MFAFSQDIMLTTRPDARSSTSARLTVRAVSPSTASSAPTEPSSTRTTSSATGGSTLTAPRPRLWRRPRTASSQLPGRRPVRLLPTRQLPVLTLWLTMLLQLLRRQLLRRQLLKLLLLMLPTGLPLPQRLLLMPCPRMGENRSYHTS
jgi:hypothetical protein